ncbi:hypothetical protein EVAR_95456_1 [Eumeta japonica]|uniref:Uncharacterized protein n=1 Tax=Eumeta variegata TaxID=151549 RepID=A0A4C1UIP1_EUMVA|nr:hypothetical protein EVAR_95456_1 [Eumeta japonica]
MLTALRSYVVIIEKSTSYPYGAEGVPKGPVTRALIKEIVLKSLAKMGYEYPEGDLGKFVCNAIPVSSRASSNVSSPASSQNSSSTTDEIDFDIGVLTNHISTVVKKCERDFPSSSDRRRLPPDILELLRAKNVTLRCASTYPTPKYRSRALALQSEVKTRR